jgi:hypothetical protein
LKHQKRLIANSRSSLEKLAIAVNVLSIAYDLRHEPKRGKIADKAVIASSIEASITISLEDK